MTTRGLRRGDVRHALVGALEPGGVAAALPQRIDQRAVPRADVEHRPGRRDGVDAHRQPRA